MLDNSTDHYPQPVIKIIPYTTDGHTLSQTWSGKPFKQGVAEKTQ